MSERMQGSLRWLLEKDRWVGLTVALGIGGMALILFSSLWPQATQGSQAPAEAYDGERYVQQMQTQLQQLLMEVEGVGSARVMITLEQESERIYAREEKNNTDKSMNYEGENPIRVEESGTSEASYILVDAYAGGKQPLLLSVRQPQVRGVVVVCEGGKDPVVQQRVTEVVTTALDLPAQRVCVIR